MVAFPTVSLHSHLTAPPKGRKDLSGGSEKVEGGLPWHCLALAWSVKCNEWSTEQTTNDKVFVSVPSLLGILPVFWPRLPVFWPRLPVYRFTPRNPDSITGIIGKAGVWCAARPACRPRPSAFRRAASRRVRVPFDKVKPRNI